MYIGWVFEEVRGETVDVVVDFSNDCIVVAEIRTRDPVAGVRGRVRGSSGWVGGYIGENLDVGEDGALGVDYPHVVWLWYIL